MTKKKTTRAGGRKPVRRDSPTALSVRAAREALESAIVEFAIARGDAQWTNGYRCGAKLWKVSGDAAQMRDKELAQWAIADVKNTALKRAIATYTKAVRSER